MGINKTLFKSAGVDLKPDFDVTWTHDDFLKMLKQVAHTGGDGNLDRSGIDGWEQWTYWLRRRVPLGRQVQVRGEHHARRGRFAVALRSRLVAPRDATPQTERPVAGCVEPGAGGPGVERWPLRAGTGLGQAALRGRRGAYPIVPGGRHHRFYSDGFIMWAGSKKQDAALDVLAYLGTDCQDIVEKAGVDIFIKLVAEGNFLKHTISSGTNGATFTKKKWIDAINGAKLQPLVVPYDDMDKVVTDNRTAVLAGTVGPKQAIESIERDVNALLGEKPNAESKALPDGTRSRNAAGATAGVGS